MATSKERQRKLARAKWERQEYRRARADSRARKARLVVGVLLSLVVMALIAFAVVYIIRSSQSPDQPTVPGNPTPAPPSPTAGASSSPSNATPSNSTPSSSASSSPSPSQSTPTGGTR